MLNKESNLYIILFCTILVVITGVGLASVSLATKDAQSLNIELEKKQNILQAVNIIVERDAAAAAYEQYIKEGFAINSKGEIKINTLNDVFNIDLAKELKKPLEEQLFPVYICEKEGEKYYILPMRGKGLWDAIWGYVSIEGDFSTVYGASFDHKGETPGLGAEIKETPFQAQFKGKKITDVAGTFMSIAVVKPGQPQNEYNVDGISGGTLTSNGVHDMLKVYLSAFYEYSKKVKVAEPVAEVVADSTLTTDSSAVVTDSIQVVQEK
jgi:Na+-transporting NADH:ubiquinone oxidoreductase subunit C